MPTRQRALVARAEQTIAIPRHGGPSRFLFGTVRTDVAYLAAFMAGGAFHPFVERKICAFKRGTCPSLLIIVQFAGHEGELERAGFVSDPAPFLGLDELDVLSAMLKESGIKKCTPNRRLECGQRGSSTRTANGGSRW